MENEDRDTLVIVKFRLKWHRLHRLSFCIVNLSHLGFCVCVLCGNIATHHSCWRFIKRMRWICCCLFTLLDCLQWHRMYFVCSTWRWLCVPRIYIVWLRRARKYRTRASIFIYFPHIIDLVVLYIPSFVHRSNFHKFSTWMMSEYKQCTVYYPHISYAFMETLNMLLLLLLM